MVEYVDLLGKEFKIGATGPDKYDCYHLYRELSKRVGVELPLYISPTEPNLIEELIKEDSEKLFDKLDKPEPYCMVLFTIKYPYVSHMGFVLEDCQRFIHIFPKSRVTVERLKDISWNHRIRGYLKWRKQP